MSHVVISKILVSLGWIHWSELNKSVVILVQNMQMCIPVEMTSQSKLT